MTKEWLKYRTTILELYKDQGKTLDEVRQIMKEEYGFEASVRAYRSRFDKWRVSKYFQKPQAQSSLGFAAQALETDTPSFSPIQHATTQPHLTFKVKTRWIWVETPGRTTELVEVDEECASDDNFISPSQASRLGFQFKPVLDPAPVFLATTNSRFLPREYVDITWMSQGLSYPPGLSAPTETSAAYQSGLPTVLPMSTEERPLPETIPQFRGKLSPNYRMDENSSGELDYSMFSQRFKSTDRFYVTPFETGIQLLVGRKFIAQYPGVFMGEKPDRPSLKSTSQFISQNVNTNSLLTPASWAPTVDIGLVSIPLQEQQKTQDLEHKLANEQPRRMRGRPANDKFACPYGARRPATYRNCLRYSLSRIRDVKQHLRRAHSIPPHCPRCGQDFGDDEDRDAHIRENMCAYNYQFKFDKFDGITEDQRYQLSKMSSTKEDAATQWYKIFDIVFPGQARPASPYMDQILSGELQGLREGISPGLPAGQGADSEISGPILDIERQPEPNHMSFDMPLSFQGHAQMKSQDTARLQQFEASTVSYSASKPSGGTQQSFSSSRDYQDRLTEATEYSDVKTGSGIAQPQISQQGGLGLYDTRTEYSASELSKVPTPHDERYITDLAKDLYDSIKYHSPDSEKLRHICDVLPNLLRAFAVKVGYSTRTQTPRDVSYFVHKYRRSIQDAFEDLLPLEHTTTSRESDPVQNGEFALSRYLEEEELTGDPVDLVPPRPESEPDTCASPDDWDDSTTGLEYRDFIVRTPEYEWLIKTLQRESVSRRASPDILERIGAGILAALPSSHHVSRRAPSQRYEVTFVLDWDPLAFLKQQFYNGILDLRKAITITGSASDAQAVTTAEYLIQTWPTGGKIMKLIEDVTRHPPHHSVVCTLPDRTELKAHLEDSRFIVIATGPGDSVVEVGQQFAWVGAALRSSTYTTGIATCAPFISSTSLETAEDQNTESIPRLTCVVEFNLQQPAVDATRDPGQCWHNMFRNPVMVIGFPIPFKTNDHALGLEMPLNMVTTLAGSNRVHEFHGKVFIKGFSTMVIATKKIGEIVVWHYFYNADRGKLSHLDHMLGDDLNGSISLFQLESSRHVVGWCSDCKVYAGARDARQDVKPAKDLPPPSSGCRLEKFTLSGGKFITAGASFAVATKDKPTHLTMKGYIDKLKSIDEKYVVLWDESDKRGWLVNGTSALLHLVRASLYHRSRDKFSAVFRWKQSDMNESDSAVEVLINEENRELGIYADKPTVSSEDEWKQESPNQTKESTARKRRWDYTTFQDLVEQLYHFLDQIIDYQALAERSDGLELKADFRKRLEGWDFVELAKATNTNISPRVAKLEALGWGWVDFIRSIGAVTLFGNGFGEIIKPEPFEGMCPNWWSLPKAKYYLAVSGVDLEKVKFNPGRLVWHSPASPVASCYCQGRSSLLPNLGGSHHDPVQVFYPKMSRLFRAINTPDMTTIHTKGAYVFGYNITWPYRWRPGKHKDGEDIEESSISSTHGEQIPGVSIEPCSQYSTPETGSYVVTPSAHSEPSSTTDTTTHPSLPSTDLTAPTSVETGHHIPHRSKRTLPSDASMDIQAGQTWGGSSSGGEPAGGQERRAKRRKQREAEGRRV